MFRKQSPFISCESERFQFIWIQNCNRFRKDFPSSITNPENFPQKNPSFQNFHFWLNLFGLTFLATKKRWPIYGPNDPVFIPMMGSCISCFYTRGWALNLTQTSSPTSCTGSSAFTTTSNRQRFCRQKIFFFKLKLILIWDIAKQN